MSIRPVDYQILMPKVNEVAKLQNAEHQKVMSHIQQQAESSAKQGSQDARSVHSQKEAQKSVISEKQKDRKKGKGQEKKGQNNKNEKEGTAKGVTSRLQERHTIDIRL